ncbi:Hsp70 family protein [Myxococcaceae bacterium GXIMD 01537]
MGDTTATDATAQPAVTEPVPATASQQAVGHEPPREATLAPSDVKADNAPSAALPPVTEAAPSAQPPGIQPEPRPTPPSHADTAPSTDTPAPSESALKGTDARPRRRAVLDVPTTQPSTTHAPEVILGIDLGTTRARAAVFHEGRAQLIPTGDTGTAGVPSILAVDPSGHLLVGEDARAEAEREPRHAAFGLKRLFGMRARSPQVRWLEPLLPFSVVPDAHGDASVELLGRVVPVSEFATLLLRELRAAATVYLGRDVTRAVLCVPAGFNGHQRAALREAGARAGLTIQRVLNAPAAAALAFGHGRGLARKRVLIVDLGGGGLEVSVVQVTGDDLEVITTGGDSTLGGMEFDARIAEAAVSDLQQQGVSRPEHPLDWSPLRQAAEAAKEALSERAEAPIPLRTGTVPPLPRERLDALTADLVQRVTTVVREVLESCALTPQGLDAVQLVGGQGRAPLVRQRLEESLGVPVRTDVDPSGAVALGAALLGHSLLEAEAGKPAASVSEVLTLPLGVAERGGTLRRVLERNTRLPAEKTLVLPVTPGPLALALFQGASSVAAESEFLGTLELAVERPGEVELHFSVSTDGTLTLEATLPGAKRQPLPLATAELDEAARGALVARSPLASEPEAKPAGILSGLKKLFGRR